MAFPKFWEILFGSSGDKTILSERLPDTVVKTETQSLADDKKEQARENINAADASMEGIYEAFVQFNTENDIE